MKKKYSRFLFLALLAIGTTANAQCTSCTTTISGADASNYIVSAGQTLCVASTGIASGLITVSTGGTLCNEGMITSSNIWIAGGTFYNYGNINTGQVLVDTQGDFNNYNVADIDSLLVTNIYSTFVNSGALTGIRLAFSDNSTGTNNSLITVDYMGDSVAQFTNNVVAMLTINFDLYNAYNSGFFNYSALTIGRDFYNSTGSTFETACMVTVDSNWYNSAIILGPALSSCGGFNVGGGSYNSGTVGSSSTHIDICDSGNPPLGMDGPGGTIAGTTTYCTCSNMCAAESIEESAAQSSVLIRNLYPNPASNDLTIELESKDAGQIVVEVIDMLGRIQSSVNINTIAGSIATSVNVSTLSQGTYILTITDSKKLSSKQLFTVVK